MSERVLEKGDLNVVDEHREFAGIVDRWSDRGCIREHALHARQERAFDVFVGEKIEIDGYAVTNLERKRGATREIEARKPAQ
jgi:hypothetical protein